MKKFGLAMCIALSLSLTFGQIGSLGQNRKNAKLTAEGGREAAVIQQDATQRPVTSGQGTSNADTATLSLVQEKREVAAPKPDINSKYTLVFSVPAGGEGVHYEGGQLQDTETSGPASLRIASDGSFLIVDTVGDRILRFGKDGTAMNALEVKGVQAVTDVAVSGGSIFALDDVAEDAAVQRFSEDGAPLEKITLPEGIRSKGLSGLTVDDNGVVLAEVRGGAAAVDLYGQERKGKTLAGAQYTIQSSEAREGAANRKSGTVIKDDLRINVKVNNSLGGLNVLGRGLNGDTFVLVEELSDTHVLRVDQTVRRYDSDGNLLGVARIPLAERHSYVRNGVAVGPDGQVYALITRPDRADVVRLKFSRSLKSILPEGDTTTPQFAQSAASKSQVVPYVGAPVMALATTCRSRDEMYNAAMAYVNNRTYLSATNINSGTCTGRGKPRYLGSANYYSSVPYDWGGYDTVSEFNSYMSQNYVAGDIDDAGSESCSRGVDCSGFVSRVWNTSRYTTSSLPNISTKIARTELQRGDIINLVSSTGSHVAMFDGLASDGGVYTIEATAYNKYDRVVNIYNGWTRFNGYSFYRYNNVCGTTSTTPARPVVSSSLRLSSSSAKVGDTLSATFTITNRGGQSITFNRLLTGGRMDGDPNCTLGCPDFSSTGTLTLAPGQSYSYSGSRSFNRTGTYSYFVTYQKTDGSWVSNVDTENGAANTARVTINAPPLLTRHTPTTVYVSAYDQTVYLYGEGLTNTSYVKVQFPSGGVGNIYPTGQIFYRSFGQLSCKIKFGTRGQYYLWAYTPEGGWSNARAIYVY